MEVPNELLISLMTEAGASNKGLAKRMRDLAHQRGAVLGTTHVSVKRWSAGAGIQPQTAAILRDVLSDQLGRRLTLADLGLLCDPEPQAGPAHGYPASAQEALAALDALAGTDPNTMVTGPVNATDNGLDSAVLTWMLARPDGVPAAEASARRVGMRDVHAIRTAGGMFMRLDFLYGGGHGHRALRHYFRHEVLPMLAGNHRERVGTALFSAATEIAQLLAWTAYDSGKHALAHRYLISTLRLTQVTGDRMAGARILSNLSHQANYLGHHPQALRLARAAVEGARHHATPRAMSLYTAMEARALGRGSDAVGAARAMNEAERHFERADTGNDPGWLAYFDAAELQGELAHCFRDLKQHHKAVRHAQGAVTGTDPQYARTLGFCRMVLAQSLLLHGELEAALATATVAVDEGDSLQSTRFLGYVTGFQQEVDVHAGHPRVAVFHDRVREALARMDEED
ncbi:sporulation protein [Streptomyces yaizuensis]|uniref:Sporulation protein n=1 Tax=Streptomyces yaizuensis TaxID=2989713 RepID=A0ABQ5NXW3_9ACTN|nr:sporulation protein [Streptomyces sp. YSPA8]GLF95219.1 sporulation protein [Streptomyces sp. YSPA8]